MVLDYTSNETLEYQGVFFVASQFRLQYSNTGVCPSLVMKIDTDLKRIHFWIPEDGDLSSKFFTGRFSQRCGPVQYKESILDAFLIYHDIEIDLFNGPSTPAVTYKEYRKSPKIDETLKEAYKEVLIDRLLRRPARTVVRSSS